MKKFIYTVVCFLAYVGFANGGTPETEYAYNTSLTKFGLLTFIRAPLSHQVLLNGKILLAADHPNNPNGYRAEFFEVLTYVASMGKGKITEDGKEVTKRFVDRIIVAEGEDGNCFKHLYIVDLRGDKPYVTKPFYDNPEGKFCLEFKGAKWGKRESSISFENGMKYIYYTGGRVIGPIE
jgi:hypothetical protein